MDLEGGATFGRFLGRSSTRIEGLRSVTPDGCFLFAHESNIGGWCEEGGGAGRGAAAGNGGVGGIGGAAAVDVVLVLSLLHIWGVRIA